MVGSSGFFLAKAIVLCKKNEDLDKVDFHEDENGLLVMSVGHTRKYAAALAAKSGAILLHVLDFFSREEYLDSRNRLQHSPLHVVITVSAFLQ